MKYMIIIFSTTYLFLWNDLRKTFGRGGVEARWRGAGCGLWGNLEGTLGMGKEQVGSVSSKHSTTDSVLFDPLHARACVRAYLNLVPTTMPHGDLRDSVGLFSVETVVSPAVSYRGFRPVVCMFQENQSDGRTD
jgi:hypothetical protein